VKGRKLIACVIAYLLALALTLYVTHVVIGWAERIEREKASAHVMLEVISAQETAWEIARRQGGDPRRALGEMERLNPGRDLGRLQPGDMIWVGGGEK
jgi:hypothetical protein